MKCQDCGEQCQYPQVRCVECAQELAEDYDRDDIAADTAPAAKEAGDATQSTV